MVRRKETTMRAAKLIGITALALVVLRESPARADPLEPLPAPVPTNAPLSPARPDTVYLRSGGMLRGRVHEFIPGHHVTATLETTAETRVIPWAEVDRVILGDATATIPPPLLAGVAAAPPPMVGPRARVHITSPKLVQLYRRPAGTTGWTNACASPCDADLPVGDDYRISGSGVAQSSEFRLKGGDHVELVVNPTSTGGMVAGGLVAGTGAFAVYVGFLTTLVGSVYAYDRPGPAARDAGIGIMLVGAAATALGLVVLVNSAGTEVSQQGGPTQEKDAFLREPTWRGFSSRAAGTSAAFPIFSREF